MKRKAFLRNVGLGVAGLGLPASALPALPPSPMKFEEPNKSPTNEAFWKQVASEFARPDGIAVNLENGYFSHSPKGVLQAHIEAQIRINQETSLFMRGEQQEEIEKARRAFASFQGIDPEQLAFTRNTTEALNIVIMGYPWKAGDEVILGDQDYGSMVEAFEQVSRRHGVILRYAQVPMHPKNAQQTASAYLDLITPKTKMLHLTHLINLSGQLIDGESIAKMAKERNSGIFTVLDAAHSIAHHTQTLQEMPHCDAVGGSLHKWLCNPLGVGFLHLKLAAIPLLWPLMGDVQQPETNIRRFEHQGTRPINSLMSLSNAIAFHEALGSQAKKDRLMYLKHCIVGNVEVLGENYDKNQHAFLFDLSTLPKLQFNCPWKNPEQGGAIINISIDGMSPAELAAELKELGIFTVAIDHAVVKGVRITPHLSNTLEDCLSLNRALLRVYNQHFHPIHKMFDD